jgi:hypothetical protein
MIAWNYLSASLLCFIGLKPILRIFLSIIPLVVNSYFSRVITQHIFMLSKVIAICWYSENEIAQRLAVILSLLAAYFIFGEQFSQLKLIGVVLGLLQF